MAGCGDPSFFATLVSSRCIACCQERERLANPGSRVAPTKQLVFADQLASVLGEPAEQEVGHLVTQLPRRWLCRQLADGMQDPLCLPRRMQSECFRNEGRL
jgi:hypothetical protein